MSPPTPAVPDGPPGPARLRSWLTGAALRSAAATRLLAHLRSSWGGRRIDTVVDWSLRLRDTSVDAIAPAPRLLHGAASLAALVPPVSRGRPTVLLTGEELSAGDPEADLGWLVGELAEMRWNSYASGRPGICWSAWSTRTGAPLRPSGPLGQEPHPAQDQDSRRPRRGAPPTTAALTVT
ncbi:hypothetical protein [Streptomyces sp. S186]|uniref:hypothetical protein n=1 Tax=Streptomyces sp. S186 TaxID=3434395 RepID=UPI003F66D70A